MCRLSVWLLNIMFQNVKPLLFEIIWLIRFAWCFTNTMICEEWTDALEVEVRIENGGEWFCIEIWQYLEKDEKWRKSCRRSQIRMKRVEQKRTFLCFCLLRVTSEMFAGDNTRLITHAAVGDSCTKDGNAGGEIVSDVRFKFPVHFTPTYTY